MRHAAAVLLLSLCIAVPAIADSCQRQDDPPYNYIFVCYPTYGYPMYQQPDYSLYAIGTIWWFHKTSGKEQPGNASLSMNRDSAPRGLAPTFVDSVVCGHQPDICWPRSKKC